MFSSTLDTVREADRQQLTLVEAFLMRSALSGNPAVLAPNQAVDSAAIQAIVAGNDRHSTNYFIEAVRKGIVRVALPANVRTMMDYCLSTVQRCLEDPQNEFIFSSLKFLYAEENGVQVHDYAFRSQVLQYIASELTAIRRRNHTAAPFPVELTEEEKASVERYIHAINALDRAITEYNAYAQKKMLYPKILEHALAQRLQATDPQTPLAQLLTRMIRACSGDSSSIYRSYYYRLCDTCIPEFGSEAVAEVRQIIDICYNKLIAISMQERAEINIPTIFETTISVQASGSDVAQAMLMTASQPDTATETLDWEVLVEIYEAVDALCREKGLPWQQALEKYYAGQNLLPFKLGGKYAIITAMNMAISSIPVVGTLLDGAVSQILMDTLLSEVEGIVGKPSLMDIVTMGKKAKKRVDMMDVILCTKI